MTYETTQKTASTHGFSAAQYRAAMGPGYTVATFKEQPALVTPALVNPALVSPTVRTTKTSPPLLWIALRGLLTRGVRRLKLRRPRTSRKPVGLTELAQLACCAPGA